jgi:hypothetical protein
MKLEEKYKQLWKEVFTTLDRLIEEKGKKSEYNNEKVLKVENEDLQFNLELNNGHYVEEISKNHLISNYGDEYNFECIEL